MFCGTTEWMDSGHRAVEIKHDDFDPEAMKCFLQYVYQGKIKIDFKYVISVMRISSYYGVDSLQEQIKGLLDSDLYSALDLCFLYKEVRQRDFDGMCSFISEIIPWKSTSDQICKILKEIWIEKQTTEDEDGEDGKKIIERDSDEENDSGDEVKLEWVFGKPKSTAADSLQSWGVRFESKSVDPRITIPWITSELLKCKKKKNEVLTDLSSVSDEETNSNFQHNEEDNLQAKLINIIQSALPEIYSKEETREDLIKLPRELLIELFESDKSCASEILFFKLLVDISNSFKPQPVKVHANDGKSSVETIQDDRTINEEDLEEEKEDM
jgi:hypothetical protein